MSDPYETAAANAAKPAKYSLDGESVEQHSLKDQIELADRQAAAESARKPKAGLRFMNTKPPGMS